MRQYGQPGGIYIRYELDLDRGKYVVYSEGGDELAAFEWEVAAQIFCEAIIEREANSV